ncbi:DedA family protein [Parachlamydia sp. AcF125]|uniref:DedA family protein n=1 Tax=Parachlamydia sp. AcF125 TaxID=2795736 RepID=UPI001BC96A00|nr:DedA family protein [Parachlamydia sp. AcF125]MBS4167989.1 Inner membrane protein [Parachlamydia sp. AcF125]
MEEILQYACSHAHSAHWFIFLLLMLAGFNVPISEDLCLLTAGTLASTCIPEQTLRLFVWVYMGCWLSASIAYWIGRRLGPRLYDIRWFNRILTPQRIARLHHYYEKFGIFTFIIGRFVPGGARNALFMTAGLGKMHYLKFLLRDGFACLISSSALFYLGYSFGANYAFLIRTFKTYNFIFISILASLITLSLLIVWIKKRRETPII